MEEPMPLLYFRSNKTSEMEDYISAGHDIRYVTFLTKEAFEIAEDKNNTKDFMSRLYFENALVTYARPFATGVRSRLDPQKIFDDRDDMLEYHTYLIAQRNKLVAHNVNPFEETTVGILVDSDNQVMGVGNLTGRLVGFTKNDYGQFNQLANKVLGFINKKLQKLEQEITDQARQLSPKELSKLKTVRFTAPKPKIASDSKKRSS